MIVLVGENVYARDEALRRLVAEFDGEVVVRDGDELSLGDIPDLLMGQSLFSTHRMIILKRLSENSELWQKFEEWHKRTSEDIQLVIIEDKPDKRTVTWKYIQKHGDVREFSPWNPKQSSEAAAWVVDYAKDNDMAITHSQARYLIDRVGFDQYSLAHAIDKLVLAGSADKATVDQLVDQRPEETVFDLLEQSLKGNIGHVQRVISTVKRTEDAYRVMALLSSQILQLAAIYGAGSEAKASDIKVPPFVFSKLRKLTKYYSPRYLKLAAETDHAMKTTNAQPWELVERMLLEIAAEQGK